MSLGTALGALWAVPWCHSEVKRLHYSMIITAADIVTMPHVFHVANSGEITSLFLFPFLIPLRNEKQA